MFTYAQAILWAQIRTLRNFYPRGNMGRFLVTAAMAAVWYGMWVFGAMATAIVLAKSREVSELRLILGHGLMAVLLYWQFIPVLMVSTGASLDLKRLRIYPVPPSHLFRIEVLLRLSTGVEMIVVLTGATVGLLANPLLPFWAPLGLVPFAVLNLFLCAGLRHLLERILARKYVREFGFLLLVSAAALPQVLIVGGYSVKLREFINTPQAPWLPWSSGAGAILGGGGPMPWVILMGWVLLAYAFGRWQFEKGLRFDSRAADVRPSPPGRSRSRLDGLFRLPSLVLRDPLSAIVEKEIRSLVRAPRFRVVFVMGFTFGLLIWLPMAVRGRVGGGSFFTENYLTFVSLYALLLLGEVSFWNAFGFDRASVQTYFLIGLPPDRVLLGKNIAALIFVFIEVSLVAVACYVLRMPVTVPKLAESYLVAFALALYMLSAGNLGSTHYPRPVDPRQSFRSTSASRFQAMLLIVYPVIALPVGLAFLVRYTTESDLLFFAVLGVALGIGAVAYRLTLRSSVKEMIRNQEQLLAKLSAGGGPISL